MLLTYDHERIILICFKKGWPWNLTFGDKSIMNDMGLGVVKIKMFDGVVHSLVVLSMLKNCVRI